MSYTEATRPTDLVSDVLRAVRLEGTLYFEARLAAPWGLTIPTSGFANFHHVVDGSCWVAHDGGPWTRLGAGHTIVFPHGVTHSLCHEPGDRTIDGRLLFDRVDDDGVARLGGSGSPCTLVCGHFSFDRELNHPLFQSLPDAIRSEGSQLATWTTLTELAVANSARLSPGSQALTDRLAEVLLIELLSAATADQFGFIDALSDPIVASALHALHADPAREWTVESLASEVAASRSTLATRFTELVGESPMRYLTRWRMHRATELLRDTRLPAARVATLVGYSTPFSFTKAFTREIGVNPSTYRNRADTC